MALLSPRTVALNWLKEVCANKLMCTHAYPALRVHERPHKTCSFAHAYGFRVRACLPEFVCRTRGGRMQIDQLACFTCPPHPNHHLLSNPRAHQLNNPQCPLQAPLATCRALIEAAVIQKMEQSTKPREMEEENVICTRWGGQQGARGHWVK